MPPKVNGNHELGKWCLNGPPSHYPRFYSGPCRNQYVHRAIFEHVAGRPVKPGFEIHHMNGKLCFCPHQLLECPPAFNPQGNRALRDPYTGQFLSPNEYQRRYL